MKELNIKIKNLRENLVNLTLIHDFNFIHPEVIQASQELDKLINEAMCTCK